MPDEKKLAQMRALMLEQALAGDTQAALDTRTVYDVVTAEQDGDDGTPAG
jgi:hypothetical protein